LVRALASTMSAPETIAAIATPPGTGGIGILRISGPDALAIGEAISASKLEPGLIQFRRFLDADGETIDHGLCLYFRAPHSFSGEDSVELQAHGGAIVLDMLLERLCALGARLARAGEFSERAFLNGRLDLTQAEAIADLIESGSRAASRAAMRSLEGRFSERVNALVDEIIELRAYVEAALDFAEEEIDFLEDSGVDQRLGRCTEHLRELLDQAEQGRSLQEGLTVALAGLPNAGKSSLLNYLAGYEAAIVTDIEGTTRDVLREQLSLKGIPVRISDTAGLRDTDNPVEQEGVRRAWKAIEQADAVLYLVDSTRGLVDADRRIIGDLPTGKLQLVYSKCDLAARDRDREDAAIDVSVVSGEGMELLIQRITGQVADLNQDNQAFMARRRHVEALRLALGSVSQARETLAATRSGELIAEDLRGAQRQLNEITGEFTSDDLLGRIFSSFCIGK
jgi:tRNA modification GTPase